MTVSLNVNVLLDICVPILYEVEELFVVVEKFSFNQLVFLLIETTEFLSTEPLQQKIKKFVVLLILLKIYITERIFMYQSQHFSKNFQILETCVVNTIINWRKVGDLVLRLYI